MSAAQSLNAARARALELACRLLVRELDQEVVEALRQPDLCAALQAYDPGCGAYLDALHRGGRPAFDDAAAEYCALFVLGRRTSPYASAWLDGDPAERGAAVAQAVARWMDQLGVEIAPGQWGNIPRDHVAVLSGTTAIALLAPQPAGERLARSIVAETLPWVPRFARAVSRETTVPLYRAAARLLEHVVGELQASPD